VIDVARIKDFAVIGLGTFGLAITRGLIKRGNFVLGIDRNRAIIDEHSGEFTDLVKADTTQIETLQDLGLVDFNGIVVSIGDTESNILTVQLLKEIGVKFVIARARSETHEHILYKLGADKVINPEKDMGERVAMMLTGGLILEIIDLAEDFSVAGIKVGEKYNGMTLQEIEFRKKFGVTAIMVRRGSTSYPLNSPDDRIFKGDVVFVTGSHKDLESITEI
jgi:trk system potassium uptake protein TrkA